MPLPHICRNAKDFLGLARRKPSQILLLLLLSLPGGLVFADGVVGIGFSRSLDRRGLVVEQVVPGSPADDAELRFGAIVTAVNGRAIKSVEEFKRIVSAHLPGQRVTLTIVDGETVNEVKITVADSRTKFVPRPQTAEVKEALEEIRDTSGKATADFRRPGNPVVQVEYRAQDASSTTIRLISYLPDLKTLRFWADDDERRKFSGEALAELARTPKFTEIVFERNLANQPKQPVVDETVIDGLSKIGQLRALRIWGDNISPATIQKLSKLTQLTSLSLRNTPLTDDGLEAIGQLTILRELDLGGTKISGKGLQSLKGLKELTILDLEDVPLQNDDLAILAPFVNLTVLDLSRSFVTDGGLTHLGGLSKLTYLGLNYAGHRKPPPPDTGGGSLFNEIVEATRYEVLPQGGRSPIATSGITVEGLAENLKNLKALKRLEVRGPDLEPSDVRGLARIWPKAFIVSNRKTVEPPQEH